MQIYKLQQYGNRIIWSICLIVLFIIAIAADFKLVYNIYQRLGIWPALLFFPLTGGGVYGAFRAVGRNRGIMSAWQQFSRWLCANYVSVTIAMVVFSLCLRGVWLSLFQIVEFQSDFEAYFLRAKGYADGIFPVDEYSALFPHVFGFSYVLGLFLKLFGSTVLTAQVFNIALYLISVLLLAMLFPAGKHPGRFLVFVLAISCWPSLVYFTLFPNTEYLFLVCWLLFLLVLKQLFRSTFAAALPIAGFLLLLVALSNFIRPIGSIVVIIFVLALFLTPVKWRFVQRAAILLLGLAVYMGTSALLNGFVSQHIHLPAASTPVGFNVFVGTNPHMQGEDLGLWNRDDSYALSAAYLETGDAQAAHNLMLQQGGERLKHWFGSGQGLYFLAQKIKTAWGTDSWALQLVDAHLAAHAQRDFSLGLFRSVQAGLIVIGDLLYASLLTAAPLILLARLRRSGFAPRGLVPLAGALFLIGTFLLLLLVESAPRYHLPGFIALLLLLTVPRGGTARRGLYPFSDGMAPVRHYEKGLGLYR